MKYFLSVCFLWIGGDFSKAFSAPRFIPPIPIQLCSDQQQQLFQDQRKLSPGQRRGVFHKTNRDFLQTVAFSGSLETLSGSAVIENIIQIGDFCGLFAVNGDFLCKNVQAIQYPSLPGYHLIDRAPSHFKIFGILIYDALMQAGKQRRFWRERRAGTHKT